MAIADTAGGGPADEVGSYARIRHEFVHVELLGMDPEHPAATETMSFCSALLGVIALRPEEVTLVITGDFVESVKQRLPAGEYRDNYGVERGAGMVGGKTMQVDGEVNVILPAELFVTDTATIENPSAPGEVVTFVEAFGMGSADERDRLARRTVLHEAQHVAMIQAGEDTDPTGDHPWVRLNYLNIANQVISEYRAERGVLDEFRAGDDEVSVLSGLRALRADFYRIAAVEYQEHLDTGRLQYGIVQESHTVWKLLSYFAAARQVAGVPVGTPISAELASSEEWSIMAAPHWERFEALLAELPPGAVRAAQEELAQTTSDLADLFPDWLATFGFLWRDVGDNQEFLIQSWDLIL